MYFSKVVNFIAFFSLLGYCVIFVVFITDLHQIRTNFSFYSTPNKTALEEVKTLTNCFNNPLRYQFNKRGDYIVLYNYVLSSRRFKCEESITYVTHSDYRFLDSLITLVDRWQGPISIALHAPGTDFEPTLKSIIYLRSCVPLVETYVTFHLYFLDGHFPKKVRMPKEILNLTYDCSLKPPFQDVNRSKMYAAKHKLTYPINLARNVARSMTETHFVLNADIELYPSVNMIPSFLDMIARSNTSLNKHYPYVFVLHVFETEKGLETPKNKTEIQSLLKSGLAIPFHHHLCSLCHAVPKTEEWIEIKANKQMNVFHVAKRIGKYRFWEPVYIGTKDEPLYDERLTWEGMQDKIIQAYTMCIMNYSYLILNNAFLVHRPGIQKLENDLQKSRKWREYYMVKTHNLLREVVVPEIIRLYGNKPECQLE